MLRHSTRYEAQGGARSRSTKPRGSGFRGFESWAGGFPRARHRLEEVWRRITHAVVSDETELVFAGFAAFLDPPKPSAAAAISDLAQNGVAVKVVTGDNELVTQHVCAELGLPISGMLTGDEIQGMGDEALAARVG